MGRQGLDDELLTTIELLMEAYSASPSRVV